MEAQLGATTRRKNSPAGKTPEICSAGATTTNQPTSQGESAPQNPCLLVSGRELGPSFGLHAKQSPRPSPPLEGRGTRAQLLRAARVRFDDRDGVIRVVSPKGS